MDTDAAQALDGYEEVVAALSQPPKPSQRELELLALMADGLTDAEIAEKLSISAKTMRSRLHALRMKMHARTRTHAVGRGVAERGPEDAGEVGAQQGVDPLGGGRPLLLHAADRVEVGEQAVQGECGMLRHVGSFVTAGAGHVHTKTPAGRDPCAVVAKITRTRDATIFGLKKQIRGFKRPLAGETVLVHSSRTMRLDPARWPEEPASVERTPRRPGAPCG
jgi:DNA-binding CsgD family transcriptional regulator